MPTTAVAETAEPTAISIDDAIARHLELGIEQAEISGGFCFFVAEDEAGGFAGSSGAARTVQRTGRPT